MSEDNTTTNKKPQILDFASTASDVDMEAADVDAIKHKIKVNISIKPNLRLGYVRSHAEDSKAKDTFFLQ